MIISALSRRYEAALRGFIKTGPGFGLTQASGLGRQAVTLRLETLDLAKIHERAVLALALPEKGASRDGLLKRAQIFFIEAITPIEKTHLAARIALRHLDSLNLKLRERTKALACSRQGVQTTNLR